MTLPEIKAFYTPEMMVKLNGVQIDVCTKICDGQKFVETHIETLEANSGNKKYLHFYERLLKSVNMIKNN